MKRLLLVSLLIIGSAGLSAYLSPVSSTSFQASADLVAVSSDTHSIGSTANLWKDSYARNRYLPYRAESPSDNTSMGVIFAKTDGKLYFRNAAGTETALT